VAPFVLNAQELQDFTGRSSGGELQRQPGPADAGRLLAGAADLKPLLHTWSLSIEEQYYLLLPAFLAFVPRRYWVPGGLVLFLASLGMCLGLQPYKPIATFYLLPTRGWELGVGSMVALMPALMGRIRPLLAVLFWPAVAVLAVIPVFPTGLPHPGPDALLVCLATAVVIARRHPLLERSLLSRGLARIGDVSYSLYLAHWPPFAFLKNASVAGVTRPRTCSPCCWDRPRAAALPLRRDADPPLAAAALRASPSAPSPPRAA
jgi:peptidoglycan/LPS O-acetylase OafA/YrhL